MKTYLAEFFLEWELIQIRVTEKIKTQHLRSITFFFENHAVCETMWKNVIQPDRPQMAVWRMRIASWITKTTYTLRTCNTYCFSTAIMVTRTCLSATFVTHALPVLLQIAARMTQTLERWGVSSNYVKHSLVFIVVVCLYFAFFICPARISLSPFSSRHIFYEFYLKLRCQLLCFILRRCL